MAMIGLKRGTLELSPYDPEWPVFFESEKQRIQQAVGRLVLAVEHVGSTSVVGLSAKPIIDIAIALREYEDGFQCVEPLAELGYLYKGEHGVAGRHYFRTNNELVKVHIHMTALSHREWRDHLAFRDFLRSHPDASREYAALKHQLTTTCGADREKYTGAKSEFIEDILRKAGARS
jgi:GrpB-like predicted nucleotidyltransferase (UPF0157 family)